MRHLKNISQYKSLNENLRLLEEPSVSFNIPVKKVRSNVRALLSYEGVEEIHIPGSFLSVIAELTGLPVAYIIEVLAISKSTFYRVKDDHDLEMETVDKLSSLLKIYNRGIEAFEGKESFRDWLYTKIPSLGGKKPIELMKTENGRSAIMDAIDRVEFGIYG